MVHTPQGMHPTVHTPRRAHTLQGTHTPRCTHKGAHAPHTEQGCFALSVKNEGHFSTREEGAPCSWREGLGVPPVPRAHCLLSVVFAQSRAPAVGPGAGPWEPCHHFSELGSHVLAGARSWWNVLCVCVCVCIIHVSSCTQYMFPHVPACVCMTRHVFACMCICVCT